MNKPATPAGVAEIGLLFVVAVWGVNFSVIKVALEVIPPFTVNLLRFTVSLAVLTGLHLIQCRATGRSPLYDLKTFPVAVAILGLMGHAVYQAGFILGVNRLTAGAAALLIASSPIWTTVVGHFKGIDRLSGGGWLGLAIGVVGVVLVILGQTNGQIDGDALGALLMLAAACAWGLTTVFTRPLLNKGASPLGVTTAGLWVAYPVLFGMGFWGIDATDWSQVGTTEWVALVYSGGLSTGVAYWIWNVAVKRVGPSRTAAFSNLVPVVGVAAGVLLLRETITPLELAGGALVIAGLVVMRRVR
ncbi:MAG: DMT family transporter [Rubricoccaceae bacterium]